MDYINKLPKKEEPKEEPKPKKKEEPKPKKEEPKPKKKEEPKPKKEEPKEEQKEEPKNKEEVFENIKQFLDIQNELSSDKAHKYLNNDMSVKVYLLDILRRNNNDCYTHDQYGNILNEMLLSGQYSKIVNVPKKGVEIIVDDYIRCKKKGKMILIPVGLKPSQSTGHANMLILNYHRNEIELFEPHGKRVSKPRRLYETLQTFTDNFNKVLKKKYKDEKEMKFVNPDEVCPSSKQYKIFQSYEQGAIDTSKYSKKYDMRIREPGGYCLAWSMFYADLRLKFPTISNEDLIKKTSEILTNDPEKLRRFIRGQTKQLYEFYKTIQKEAGFTQEDMIRFYKLGKKGMTLKEWKEYMDMENKIDKYLDGKYKEYAKPIKL
jgi:hypothetical protein